MSAAPRATRTARLLLACGHEIALSEVERFPSADRDRASGDYTLVVVHGGPGLSDHSEIFSGITPVLEMCPSIDRLVFYDQLGCGASDSPMDVELYTLENYVSELDQVVSWASKSAGGRSVALLGHSWGGQIVLELLLTRTPAELAAVRCGIVVSAPLDESTYAARQQQIRDALDPATRAFLAEDERSRIADGSSGALAYRTLIGESDAAVTGFMQGWAALPRLDALARPALLLCGGAHDTVPHQEYLALAARAEQHARGAAGAGAGAGALRARVLPDAGHAAFFEPGARGAVFAAIEDFVRTCEGEGG
jgi:pimeloyl-ACP methyl ester carboxylesterase